MNQEIVYQCINRNAVGEERKKWKAKIGSLIRTKDGYEGIITGRSSSIFFIIGESDRGTYICLPELGIGSELADLNDVFWNRERLQIRNLNGVDAITLATGLQVIATIYS